MSIVIQHDFSPYTFNTGIIEYQDSIYISSFDANTSESVIHKTTNLTSFTIDRDLTTVHSDTQPSTVSAIWNDKLYFGSSNGNLYENDSGTWSLVGNVGSSILSLFSSTDLWIGTYDGDLYKYDGSLTLDHTFSSGIWSITEFHANLYVATSGVVSDVYWSDGVVWTPLSWNLENQQKITTLCVNPDLDRLYVVTSNPYVKFYFSEDGINFTLLYTDLEHQEARTAIFSNSLYVTGTSKGVVWKIIDTLEPLILWSTEDSSINSVCVINNSNISLETVFLFGGLSTNLYSTIDGLYDSGSIDDLLYPNKWVPYTQVSTNASYNNIPQLVGTVEKIFTGTISSAPQLIATTTPNGHIYKTRARYWDFIRGIRYAQVTSGIIFQNKWWFSTNGGQIIVYDPTFSFAYSDLSFVYDRPTPIVGLVEANSELHLCVSFFDSSDTDLRVVDDTTQIVVQGTPVGYSTTVVATILDCQATDLVVHNGLIYISSKEGSVFEIDPTTYVVTELPLTYNNQYNVALVRVLNGSLHAIVWDLFEKVTKVFKLGGIGWVLFNTVPGFVVDAISWKGIIWYTTNLRKTLTGTSQGVRFDQTFDNNTIALMTYEDNLIMSVDDALGTLWIRSSL